MGFWDPAGLSADGSVENFQRRRATEIKHGRIAMLATMGYITPEITGKFPGYLSPSAGLKFADIPNGLAAISKVPQAGWGQILLYMAYCEVSQTQEPGTAAYAGDFGFKVLTSSDPAEKTKKLNAEIANGRLAMMAIIGMFFQEVCRVVHVVHMSHARVHHDKSGSVFASMPSSLFTTCSQCGKYNVVGMLKKIDLHLLCCM